MSQARIISGCMLAGLIAAWVAPAAAAGSWSTVPSPNATDAPTEVTAVTCVSANDCWALGKAGGGLDLNTVTMHWDGAAWQAVPSPNVSEDATHLLEDIACASSSRCWAVGYYFLFEAFEVRPLILAWDGVAWRVDASLGQGSGWSRLNGVACAAANDCWAVGSDAGGGSVHPLVARWRNGTWQVQTTPATGAALSVLQDVTCVSAADCWAVGSAGAATSVEHTLALRWNGLAWSAVGTPAAAAATENVLSAISCTATSCAAVGHSFDGASYAPLALQWNGLSWSSATVVTAPASEGYKLADVACASSQDCWAVGGATDSGVEQPVRLHYNGFAWLPSLQAPDPGAYPAGLEALVCQGASACWAVGTFRPADNARALIERWDGTAWSPVAAPAGAAKQSNLLRGMTCRTMDDCWAVGMYFSGSVATSLTQHWNGAGWQIVPSPNTAPDRNNYLDEISCVAADDCWVVGSSANTLGVEGQPLAMHWDGHAWTIVEVQPLDTSAAQSYSLTSVSCISSSDCWAVGHVVEQYYRGAIVHWDGTSWTPVTVPHQGLPSEDNALYGITCLAADDCIAVGDQWTANGPYGSYYTVILRYDGTSWSLVESPLVNTERDNRLFGVSCVAADDCWAVGNAYHENGDKSLVVHWNGTAWQLADPPPGLGFLYDVDCVATDDCWAVGHPWQVEGGQSPQTFSAHWDGRAWRVVAAPRPGSTSSLDGVACAAGKGCLAVGSYSAAGRSQTLALRFASVEQVTPFTFIERTGVALGVWITSEAKTLGGFAGALPVSIDNGGQYRINSGAWTNVAGQVMAGDTISVRHVSATTANTSKASHLGVGSYGVDFTTVTSDLDRTPAAFGFATQTGVEPGAMIESDVIVPADYNTAIAIVPGPGLSYRVNGGAWQSGNGTLQPGQALQVRHTASTTSLAYTKSYIKAGGTTGYFTTRTK